MKQNTVIVTIILVAIGISGGFFGGMKYDQYQRTQGRTNGSRQFPGGINNEQIQNRNGLGRPVTGDVISKDDKSITVKTQDGGSKIVILSNTTTYSKTSEGSIEDVVIGSQVGIFGTENSDKSLTAQNIQLNPQYRMGTGSAQPTPAK